MMYKVLENDFQEIFHIHTWRCKHASMDADYCYVESAMKLGAKRIVFTDHSPFPGNHFTNRMDMEQLPEYIESMKHLKKEYASGIEVFSGLEMEYLPSFQSFHKEIYELYKAGELDLLMLGQHFYENEDGSYSFHNEDKSEEYIGLCKAIVEGANTGMFQVIAHPDRIFRRCRGWNSDVMRACYDIAGAAQKNQIVLEKNYASMYREREYRDDFWIRASKAVSIKGYDSHSVKEMEEIWKKNNGFPITQEEINRLLRGI